LLKSLAIAGRSIGRDSMPMVIAEMSGNHKGSLDGALQLVEAAARTGAHALKLQTYTADTMTLDLSEGEFFIDDPDSPWTGNSLYALYEQAHTPWEWHGPIFRRAHELGMTCFSSPFDETAVDFLESLAVPCYKVASFENTDTPLLKKIAATGKPMIISTGMATVAELDETVRTARAAGCEDLLLLKCTSTYPATPESSNLLTIPHMRALFGCEVGLSDHSLGIGVAVAAVAMGATVIEKHLTLDRNDGGVDSSFSLEPADFAQLVVETGRAWQALGTVAYGPTDAEQRARLRRRSVYVTQDLEPGDVLTTDNVRCIRPGLGLAPKHFESLLGRRVGQAVKKGTPMRWDLVD
jgi:pseudaminic acid synthase